MTNCVNCELGPTPLPKSGKDCGIVNNTDGNCVLDAKGHPIPTPVPSGQACTTIGGLTCPTNETCSPFDLTTENDSCIANSYIQESINIAGAVLNVYKLLGVHEQGLLQDLVGYGSAISNGDLPNFPAANAFDKFQTEWRSLQTGNAVISKSFIGYDFGNFKLDNGRVRYGIETAIKQDIAMIKIKQGCNTTNRVTKVRIERSNDGEKWFGVTLLNLEDCDGLVSYNFQHSVPSRYWRVRPLAFNGGPDDYWVVQALQMIDYEETKLSNIQDRILLENRDRAYSSTPVRMKCAYTPLDVISNSTKFGFNQSDTDRYILDTSFPQTVQALGRPFVIGDILELPSETQYTPDLRPVLKYLQVDDVAWANQGFTANWVPTMQRLIASPAMVSQENQNVFGKLTEDKDDMGVVDIDDGNNPLYQDMTAISDTIRAEANTEDPERGQDSADIPLMSQEAIDFAKQHPNMIFPDRIDRRRGKYGIDALPPNGLPFTQGDTWPTNPKNGDYHRLTYTKSGKDIPARLYRWSSSKIEWVYLETDKRHEYNNTKPILQEFLNPQNNSVSVPIDQEYKPKQ